MNPIIIKTDLITPLTQIKSVTPVTAILDSHNSSSVFEPGQKYQASIEALLFNGNSRVLVAGKLLQMSLPESFQPGNKLELMFISQEPKLKFFILNETSLDGGANTSISATGRFLGTLMQDTLKQPSTSITHTVTTQPLTSSTPILTNGAPANSIELPGLLQKAIVQSGLFYESHQAKWINGENTLENLHQEPQGKLMLVTTEMFTKGGTASINPDMPPIHTQSIPLVQQQLSTLETGHLFWRGEVWQGQPMEWEIHEQPQDSKTDSDHAAQWRTQIRLSLPQLGDITATIALNTQGINIKLDATQLETASLLKNNQLPLTIDMQSAGLNIRSLEVQHDDEK